MNRESQLAGSDLTTPVDDRDEVSFYPQRSSSILERMNSDGGSYLDRMDDFPSVSFSMDERVQELENILSDLTEVDDESALDMNLHGSDSQDAILASAVLQSDSHSDRQNIRATTLWGAMGTPYVVENRPVESEQRANRKVSVDKPHMRRLSRSMSISLQKTKSAERDLVSALDNFDESIYNLVRIIRVSK